MAASMLGFVSSLSSPRGRRSLCRARAATTQLYSNWGKPVVPNTNLALPKPLLISIEGNIGAGKSTLLDALRESNPDWVFIDEPVGVWSAFRNEGGENMLEVFYRDRKRWSYTFQNCALLTRFQNIETAIGAHNEKLIQQETESATSALEFGGRNNRNPDIGSFLGNDKKLKRQIFITERCLDTDYQVFTKMLRAEGSIDKLEYDLYERWFTQLKISATPLSAIIHVDTTPEICAQRIVKRGRDGEEAIPLEYLQALDTFQRIWVNSGDVPCIHTSADGVAGVIDFVERESLTHANVESRKE